MYSRLPFNKRKARREARHRDERRLMRQTAAAHGRPGPGYGHARAERAVVAPQDRDPSVFVGGVPNDLGQGYRIGQGSEFVLEGDEYDSAFFDKGSKFLHYRPQTAILTSIELDHVDFRSELVMQETFGPPIPIIRCSGLDDVIAKANATAFGLSSGVCTNRFDHAQRLIEALRVGTVNVWEVPGYRIEMSPFGGIKDSGNGIKEGVVEAMKYYTNVKTYSLPWPLA